MTSQTLLNNPELCLTIFVLVLSRIAAFLLTFPLFKGNLPHTVKVAIAVSLTITWIIHSGGADTYQGYSNITWFVFGLSVARESIVGAAFGYVSGLFLTPARIAGAYISQEMGLSMAALTDPSSGETTTVVSELFYSLSVLVLFITDSHLFILNALFGTFERFPIGGGLSFEYFSLVSKAVSETQHWGLQIAAPVGAALFLMTVALSTIMKSIPQFNLFNFGSSLRLVIGLLSIFIFLPEMVLLISRVFSNMQVAARHFGI